MKSKIDFIEGNTHKNLMKLFIPLFLAMTLTMLYSMVDGLWVGNMLGENGMSALTAGTALVLIMNSLAMGMGNGISVMFAHYIGNRDVKKIPGASAAVLTAGIVISLVLTIIVEIMLGRILAFMGTPEEVFSDAILYLRIYMIGNSALFIYMLFTSIFRAFGDSMFQMKGMIVTVIVNTIADPFFIKPFGLAGAAAVTVVSEIICLLYAVMYFKKTGLLTINFREMKPEYIKTMMKLSVPTTIQSITPPISSAVMISFVSSFGLTALAGFGVARNLELIMFMPATGMCMALSSICGQCEGSGRTDRAGDYLKAGLVTGGVLTAILSFAVIMYSKSLTGMYGQGSEVAAVVGGFFKVLSVGYVLYMLTCCMQGFITGLGNPGRSMILQILYYYIFRIPVTVFMKAQLGLKGIWIAFLISHILAFIVAVVMTEKLIKFEEKRRMNYEICNNI